jgi:acyl carrier protein
MNAEIFARLQKVIFEQLCVEAETVTPQTFFEHDLRADSLRQLDLVLAAETEFEIEIADAEEIRSVGDAVALIARLVRTKELAAEIRAEVARHL